MITDIKVGCDPEMFLYSEKDSKFVPVCGLVGGTKEEPLFITDKGHALQEDNVMVEYCIPPCTSAGDLVNNIIFVKNYINDTVLKKLGLVTKCVASARFASEDLSSMQAQLFGCSESINAWSMETNSVGREDPLLRTAGGHIHVGYNDPDVMTSIKIMKAMDLFLGVPSIFLDPDTERRKMYGKAGECRLKQYGAEYRVLSTFWTDSDVLMKWAFDSTMKAIEFVNSGQIISHQSDVVSAINNCDKKLALDLMEIYHLEDMLAVL